MTETKPTTTELDDALQLALNNPAQANFFYDTFLNTMIVIPALRENKKDGSWTQIMATDRFFPLYLRSGPLRAVPVFDGLERLKAWAAAKDAKATFDYLVLPAHVFLRVIATDVNIVLNEGTPFPYTFTSEILEQLRAAAKPIPNSSLF